MKQIIFEKLTVDEQKKVRAGEENPTPDTSGCAPELPPRPTATCQP